MQEFMMIFRYDPTTEMAKNFQSGPTAMSAWQEWIGGIAQAGKLVKTSRLGIQAQVIDANGNATPQKLEGAFISGHMIVSETSMYAALELVKNCPILSLGGTVELRDILPMG